MNRYSDYIMSILRQREDLEVDDTSMDKLFNTYSPTKVFSEVCQWEGLLGGWDVAIKNWIRLIYAIDLDNTIN